MSNQPSPSAGPGTEEPQGFFVRNTDLFSLLMPALLASLVVAGLLRETLQRPPRS